MSKAKVEIPVKEFLRTVTFLRAFTSTDKATSRDETRAVHFGGGRAQVMSAVGGASRAVPWDLGDVAVPADRLASALAVVDAQGVLAVEIKVDGAGIAWRGGSARGRIVTVAAGLKEFPPAPPGPGVELGPGFSDGIARASFAVAKSEHYPSLRGVYWAPDGTLMASDVDRIVAIRPSPPTPCPAPAGVLVPDHMLKAVRDFTPTHATVADSSLWLRDASTDAYGRLYNDEFPGARISGIFVDLAARAEAGKLTRVRVKPGQPTRALLMSIAAAAESPLYSATVSVTAGGFDAWSEQEDGEARVHVDADVAGGAAEFRVNAQYLVDAVGQGYDFYVGDPKMIYVASEDRAFQLAVILFA